jgi:hypothetical protein
VTVALTLPISVTNRLDVLTCTVTDNAGNAERVTVEVVGGFFFSLEEARSIDPSLRESSNRPGIPSADLVRARNETEAECEKICRQAFVPRLYREVLTGDNSDVLFLGKPYIRSVRSLAVNGVAFTTDELADLDLGRSGILTRGTGVFSAAAGGRPNVVVVYEHGWTEPSFDLKRQSLQRMRWWVGMAMGSHDPRATSLTTPDGTVTLVTPGRAGYETGWPDVDVVYFRYRDMVPVFA